MAPASAGLLLLASACGSSLPTATGTLVFDTLGPDGDRVINTEVGVLSGDVLAERIARNAALRGISADATALRSALTAERRADSVLVDVHVAWADAENATALCDLALEGYLDQARERQIGDASAVEAHLEAELSDAQQRGDEVARARLRDRLAEVRLQTALVRSPARVLDRCAIR